MPAKQMKLEAEDVTSEQVAQWAEEALGELTASLYGLRATLGSNQTDFATVWEAVQSIMHVQEAVKAALTTKVEGVERQALLAATSAQRDQATFW